MARLQVPRLICERQVTPALKGRRLGPVWPPGVVTSIGLCFTLVDETTPLKSKMTFFKPSQSLLSQHIFKYGGGEQAWTTGLK